MKHARADYQDRIIDSQGKIPQDEPVLLFRAQDKHFFAVLHHYVKLVRQDAGDINILKAILEQMIRTLEWQKNNTIKSPDMPSQQ